jgi:peptide/nickel transport system substrate-binding protein
MMDELVAGNTIVPTGNTNIGELKDAKVDSLFQQTTKSGLTTAQVGALYGQIDKQAMSDAVILPNVYATNLFYRNPAATNVYYYAPYGEYNYAVIGAS